MRIAVLDDIHRAYEGTDGNPAPARTRGESDLHRPVRGAYRSVRLRCADRQSGAHALHARSLEQLPDVRIIAQTGNHAYHIDFCGRGRARRDRRQGERWIFERRGRAGDRARDRADARNSRSRRGGEARRLADAAHPRTAWQGVPGSSGSVAHRSTRGEHRQRIRDDGARMESAAHRRRRSRSGRRTAKLDQLLREPTSCRSTPRCPQTRVDCSTHRESVSMKTDGLSRSTPRADRSSRRRR